jgi:Na+/H+ antiporter NhaD/arsenite permease-like protein
MEGPLVPIVVFLAVYVALTFEMVNKAVAAMLGVMILLVLHVVTNIQRWSSSIRRPSCCCWA